MQGIKLDIYKEWRKKKDLEWQEYYKKNPIVSYKETIKKKPKKKVKKK